MPAAVLTHPKEPSFKNNFARISRNTSSSVVFVGVEVLVEPDAEHLGSDMGIEVFDVGEAFCRDDFDVAGVGLLHGLHGLPVLPGGDPNEDLSTLTIFRCFITSSVARVITF